MGFEKPKKFALVADVVVDVAFDVATLQNVMTLKKNVTTLNFCYSEKCRDFGCQCRNFDIMSPLISRL